MNVELRNIECRRVEAGLRPAYYSKWDGGGGLGIERMNEKRVLIA